MVGGKGGGGVNFPNSYNDMLLMVQLQEDAARRAAERTADYNFFDVQTPFGYRTFKGTPGEEGFRMIEGMPVQERRFLDEQRRQNLERQQMAARQLESADFLGRPIGGRKSMDEQIRGVEEATFRRGRRLLDPGFQEEQRRLENQLVQRGIPRSSEAYTQESDRLARQQGTALENLALSSVEAGRQEHSRRLQAEIARRSAALGEIGALGSGGGRMAQFQPTPNISMATADVNTPAGLVAQVQGQNQANQLAAKGGGISGLAQLGSAALLGFGGGKG